MEIYVHGFILFIQHPLFKFVHAFHFVPDIHFMTRLLARILFKANYISIGSFNSESNVEMFTSHWILILVLVSISKSSPITQEKEDLYNRVCPTWHVACATEIGGIGIGVSRPTFLVLFCLSGRIEINTFCF